MSLFDTDDNDDMPTPEQLRQLADELEANQEDSVDDLPEFRNAYQMVEKYEIEDSDTTCIYKDEDGDVWLDVTSDNTDAEICMGYLGAKKVAETLTQAVDD